MARPDFVPVFPSLDLVEGELHLVDRKGRLVGLLRGVQLVSPEGRKPDRASAVVGRPAGAPPAREAQE